MDRTEYYKNVNYRNPVLSIRLPSRRHLEQLKRAAASEGIHLSDWARAALATYLADERNGHD